MERDTEQLIKVKLANGKWGVRPASWAGQWNQNKELVGGRVMFESSKESDCDQYIQYKINKSSITNSTAKEITVTGKFYLKNGQVIEEKVIFDKDNNRENVIAFINKTKDFIKEGFRDELDFQLTFGYTTFRGSELAAVTINEINEE